VVTDLNLRAEWQGAMGSGQSRAIHMLAISGGSATVSICAAVNACNLSMSFARAEAQDTSSKEQRISLRSAERYEHCN
jgi:prolyl-tRNA synthetase